MPAGCAAPRRGATGRRGATLPRRGARRPRPPGTRGRSRRGPGRARSPRRTRRGSPARAARPSPWARGSAPGLRARTNPATWRSSGVLGAALRRAGEDAVELGERLADPDAVARQAVFAQRILVVAAALLQHRERAAQLSVRLEEA